MEWSLCELSKSHDVSFFNLPAFLIALVSLTVVIWFTQAMRDFDLITSQRQTLLVFVGITGMSAIFFNYIILFAGMPMRMVPTLQDAVAWISSPDRESRADKA